MPELSLDAYQAAVDMQHMAADPKHSVFVSANAGSGKTRVLVERVSRILLGGARPDKILCLTYTKAAAAVMQSRLFEALGQWSILSHDDLTKALNNLQNQARPYSAKELGRARRLFARALETPGGLKVQTLHAFCESILKKFPLEAGITPGFEAVDERQRAALQMQVIEDLQMRALKEGQFANALSLLAAHKNDKDLDALYGWAMGNTYEIDHWQESGGADNLAKKWGVDSGDTPDSIRAQAWRLAPKDALKTAMRDMVKSGSADQKKAALIELALNEPEPEIAYSHYEKMFFTKKGEPYKKIVGANAGGFAIALFGDNKTGHQPETLRIIDAREHVGRAHVLALTRAVYTLAVAASTKYRELKAAMGAIDFDDQINLARRLLLDRQASDWVRYKLDGGIDHVLVDEAQDTSGAQWDIVGALSDPFFQPSPDVNPKHKRTLFAVGDEKQSIYSFQGARPEQFLKKIQGLTLKQNNTPQVKMSMSFRSSQEILNVVDEIFYAQGGIGNMFDADVFAPASDMDKHIAHRTDAGVVEFWPAAKSPEKPEDEVPWLPVPVDTPSPQSSREQLARQIAVQIKHWLAKAEPVIVRRKDQKPLKRPMQAGDIMILVTTRTGFFDAVIRNLKEHNIPVAGADRLNLTDSIAVQDLLSLAKFVLLTNDDLALAEVLKSPLFGWSEEELFKIANGRTGTLWAAMPRSETRDILTRIKSLATAFAPYEFFARTLAIVPKSGSGSLLGRIYARLGLEAEDAIAAFLSESLAHQRRGAPSLTRFVSEIENSQTIIKREMDTGQNEVRVMTVHGAKGLEAPVVILPDTTQVKTASKDSIFAVDGGGFIAAPPKSSRPEILATYQQDKQDLIDQEAMRLLYVALTRAETRLLVCGFESRGRVEDNSWHKKIENALTALGAQEFECEFGAGLRYGKPAQSDRAAGLKREDNVNIVNKPLPEWARSLRPAKISTSQIRTLSPSQLLGPDEHQDGMAGSAVRSPLWAGRHGRAQGADRFARGLHIHTLLQTLPDVPVEKRRAAALRFLKSQKRLSQAMQQQIEREVFTVLEHKDFAAFFASPRSKISAAEISLVGGAKALPDNIRFSGQIDRLCEVDGALWILDYKSNRPPPKHEDDVAPLYIRQMAAYRVLVREIFPKQPVHCALLWTDGPQLMVLSEKILDAVHWDEIYPL